MKPKTISYAEIPQLTGDGRNQFDVQFNYLEKALVLWNIDIDPDFQRGHVWTTEQRIAYVENRLRGETASKSLQFNNPSRDGGDDVPTVLVDGKQRLTAVRMFLADELPAFGYYRKQFTGSERLVNGTSFRFCIHSLQTRAEVLKWYLELNTGGVVHTAEELDRVRALLEKEEAVK